MKNALGKILNSSYSNLVFSLFLISIIGLYLLMERASVHSSKDLIEVKGTINRINQVLVYERPKNTEDDSTYHIFLNEYPSRFQVSYTAFDSKEFFKTSKRGDSVLFNIAVEDKDRIYLVDERIRSFSLKVNNKTYLSPSEGIKGFSTGGYISAMIMIISFVINSIVIAMILRRK